MSAERHQPPAASAGSGIAGHSPEAAPPVRPQGLGRQAKLAVVAIVVAALAALFWPRGDTTFDEPGGFLLDGTGRPQTLAPRLAPVTLVHFWATWCPPCMSEIPSLQKLIADYGNRSDFDVVMIAVDDVKDKVETFVGGRSAMMLYDPNWDVAHRYGTRKLPETYLVVDGRVSSVPSQERLRTEPLDGKNPRWVGMTDWADPKVRAELRKVLDRRQQ